MATKAGAIYVDMGMNVARMQKDLAKVQGHISKFSKKTHKDFAHTWQGMAVGFASVMHIAGKAKRFFEVPIKKAAEFETALVDMQKVTSRRLPLIKKEIMKLPPALGSSIELMRGYYQVISAGVTEPVKAIELLTTASQTAKAAHVDQSEVIKALTKVMAGYGGEIKTTAEAADLLFAIEKEGQTTVAELVPIMGDLAAISHELGIKSNEMAAALALITQTSGSTAEAATKYKAITIALLKPNEKLTAIIKGLGYESSKAMVAELEFAGAIKKIKEHAEKTGIPLGKLVRSAEGLIGIAALGTKNFETFGDKIESVGKKTGMGTKAWKDYEKTSQSAWDTLTASMGKMAIVIGEKLTPATSAWARALSEIAEYWTKIIGEQKTRDYASEILEGYRKKSIEIKEELLRLGKAGDSVWAKIFPDGLERSREKAAKLTIELAKIEAAIAFLTQPKKLEVIIPSIPKPELPLLEDVTPLILNWKTYMDAKKESLALMKIEQQSAHDFALLLAQDEVEKRIEHLKFIDELEEEMYRQDMTRYDETMRANEAYMKKEKAIEAAKVQIAKQAAMAMLANWNSAFAQLAKGSETAFKMWKATAIAQTIMDTYAAAQAAFKAMAGIPVIGPALGVAAAAAAIAAGMARVSAIKSQQPAAMYHIGGIVGSGGSMKSVDSNVFSGARRAHGGLGPDEVPIIAKRDEGIFTPEQMAALGESGSVNEFHITLDLDGTELGTWIYDGTRSGNIQIHERAIISR